MNPDKEYWEERFQKGTTGWDIGYVSTPLKAYFDQLRDKHLRILIPGCGHAYEGEYLHRNGFDEVYLLDLAPKALADLRERVPDFPTSHIIEEDFFQHQGTYDLIVEQTFFCALAPSQRKQYVEHMHQLLVEGGRIAGLLFDEPWTEGPPYGGDLEEYRALFKEKFHIITMEEAYNSIPPRQGSEIFFIVEKPEESESR